METIKNYLTQKSTYVGILKVLAALGVVAFAPEAEEQLVNNLVNGAAGIIGLVGAFYIIKNDRKDS